jgi:hypothetical protein
MAAPSAMSSAAASRTRVNDMARTVAEAHRRTNAGDHAMALGGLPDGRSLGGRPPSVPGGEPMQTLRASAIALPFIGLAVLIGVLSIVLSVPR